LILDSGLSAIK